MKVNPVSFLFIRLIQYTVAATLLLNAPLAATADTRIRGEFEYNLDDRALSEWQVGPTFLLQESDNSEVELEVPIGQKDSVWFIQPEITYEIEFDDLNVEFGIGIEAPFNGEAAEGFGSIEGSVDF